MTEITYFIKGKTTGCIKIGKTTNIVQRLTTMQGHSPDMLHCLKSLPGNRELEYHTKLKHLWSHGEWFKESPELLDEIAAMPENGHTNLSIKISASWDRGKSTKAKGRTSRSGYISQIQAERKFLESCGIV